MYTDYSHLYRLRLAGINLRPHWALLVIVIASCLLLFRPASVHGQDDDGGGDSDGGAWNQSSDQMDQDEQSAENDPDDSGSTDDLDDSDDSDDPFGSSFASLNAYMDNFFASMMQTLDQIKQDDLEGSYGAEDLSNELSNGAGMAMTSNLDQTYSLDLNNIAPISPQQRAELQQSVDADPGFVSSLSPMDQKILQAELGGDSFAAAGAAGIGLGPVLSWTVPGASAPFGLGGNFSLGAPDVSATVNAGQPDTGNTASTSDSTQGDNPSYASGPSSTGNPVTDSTTALDQNMFVGPRSDGHYGIGLCGAYVHGADDAPGSLIPAAPGGDAWQYGLPGGYLDSNGYQNVTSNPNYDVSSPVTGMIVVFNATEDHSWGHIEQWDGSQWVSDFAQANNGKGGPINPADPQGFYPSQNYNNVPYQIFIPWQSNLPPEFWSPQYAPEPTVSGQMLN